MAASALLGHIVSVHRCIVLLEELFCDLREEGVGEDILFRWVEEALCLHFLLEVSKLRSLCILGNNVRDDLALGDAERLREVLVADFHRRLAELAACEVFEFFRDDLVALARHDIERRHRADDLAGRRNERRIADIGAHARHLVEEILELVFHALFLELVRKVREHAARNLEVDDVRVDVEVALEVELLDEILLDLQEVLGDRSRPVSYGVPSRAATIVSVQGWDVSRANGESAQSTVSTPASIAFMYVMLPKPDV